MAGFGFDRDRAGAVELRLHPSLVLPIAQMVESVAELIEESRPEAAQSQDPLAALVGIEPGAEAPKDPAVARLFPDAYQGDDEAAAEFRRFTQRSMRDVKLHNAEVLLASLERAEVRLSLSPVEAQAWLTALNDVRLVMASRLGIETEEDAALADDDEDSYEHFLYTLLGALQGTLVDALAGQDLNPAPPPGWDGPER